MLLQAILLGLVAMLGNAEYLFGTSLLSRPLVMGALTGVVLGDIPTGVTLGATLELAFMGAFSIGASIPPEMISGTVLGTAFTITTGAGRRNCINCWFTSCFIGFNRKERWNGIYFTSICSQSGYICS